MQYGLTAKTITRAKLKSLPAGTETDWRYVWEVNYTSICGKKLLVVVHADTRYCMIFSDLKPSVWKNLQGFLHQCVRMALEREFFSETQIEKYFRLAGSESLTQTHGRKATGGMIHTCGELPYLEKTLVDGMFQPLITDDVNRRIGTMATHPEAGYVVPGEFFVERMRELLAEDANA